MGRFGKGCPAHDHLVSGLQTEHAVTLGRELVSSFGLPHGGAAVALLDEPLLDVKDRGSGGNGYPDLLAVVISGGALFSAIVEVKRTARDLLTSGRQYRKYLGCTPAFFIAVPSELLHIAVTEIRYPIGVMPFKGVINADSGDIVIRPRVQGMDLKRNLSFISKALAEDRSRRSGERCGFRDLGDWPDLGMDEFVEIDGMAVRKSYLPIAQMESRQRYPREEYVDMSAGRRWNNST